MLNYQHAFVVCQRPVDRLKFDKFLGGYFDLARFISFWPFSRLKGVLLYFRESDLTLKKNTLNFNLEYLKQTLPGKVTI